MLELTGAAWYWLLLAAGFGTALGIVVSNFVPGTYKREWSYEWRPRRAVFLGMGIGLPLGLYFQNPLVAILIAAAVSYWASRMPTFEFLNVEDAKPPAEPASVKPDRMLFRRDWNIRPRFETEEEGMFVGRREFLDRLTSHFISQGGGTILISGVRGVGKTALVDRALVSARRKLQNRYWKEASKYLNAARPWHLIDRKVRRTLLKLEQSGSSAIDPTDYLALKRGADKYVNSSHGWWSKYDPVDKRVRKMHEAARWQLFVLKFNASDIAGALAEPGQEMIGKPRINPEKLLRSVIRKLYMTCHPDAPSHGDEARILQWSLTDEIQRTSFFSTLEAAYNKSISKSYKEIITNSLNEFLKRSQSSVLEGKMSVEKVVLFLLCLTLCVGAAIAGWTRAWHPLKTLIASGVPGLIGAYFAATWTYKRSRESGTDRSRQAQFSYENDYSLDQMQRDVELIVSSLHAGSRAPFNPFRAFTRSVIVFDELDKLEQADQQLEDVITHFKNFFTLSKAVFVFLTDHEFYEHLARETVRAQRARHYPPQHTFFTEKIYLRKPEFARFREAFYRFAEPNWIEQRARSIPADPMLIDDLLKRDEPSVVSIESLPLETLTQLFIWRALYKREQVDAIEREFNRQGGWSNAFALAQIWASQASVGESPGGPQDMRKAFYDANGWKNPEAVSFLYHRKDDFSSVDEKTIRTHYGRLNTSFIGRYEGVDDAQFTLSDLARALCFQTRNHYFDLYNTVYDYVASYEDGSPVLPLDNSRFAHEPRLWSRYQQFVEIAFDSARENHPSREYFNALLMESLYRAFDKRGTGESVKVSDILFPGFDGVSVVEKPPANIEKPEQVEVAATADQEADMNYALRRLLTLASRRLSAASASGAATNGGGVLIRPFTDRDADKINQAIIRLLRLALAHDAIAAVSPELESSLKDDKRKPIALGHLEFVWKDNSHSIIRSTDREQHEQELVKFWEKYKNDLEAVDLELGKIWLNATIDGESARMRAAIGELRGKAEGVRLRTIKISGPDASALKSNVGTAESREALWPGIVVDRIRSEDDADILDEADKTTGDPRLLLIESKKTVFEHQSQLRVRTTISPRNTDAFVFFVTGPIPSTSDFSVTTLKKVLRDKTFLFWYVPGREEPEIESVEGINFYSSPAPGSSSPRPNSCAKLVADYIHIASTQRLNQILTHLEATEYKDAGLAQRAGAELLGPITTQSKIGEDLTETGLGIVLNLLTEMRDHFAKTGADAWKFYEINSEQIQAPEQSSALLAKRIIERNTLSLKFEPIIDRAISFAFKGNVSRLTPDSWVKSFLSATSEPSALTNSVYSVITEQALEIKVKAGNFDPRLEPAVREHFAPWLVHAIDDITNRPKDTGSVLSPLDLLADLEKQRRALRTIPLPPTPTDPPGAPSQSGGRRRSSQSRA